MTYPGSQLVKSRVGIKPWQSGSQIWALQHYALQLQDGNNNDNIKIVTKIIHDIVLTMYQTLL